ncbi:cd63 antigen-like protein, partial [Leptotrombidium deliense]
AYNYKYMILNSKVMQMAAIMLQQVIAIILVFNNRNEIYNMLCENFKDQMKAYYNNQEYFDKLQENMECCGAHDYSDWVDILKVVDLPYPKSCCAYSVNIINGISNSCQYSFQQGCVMKLINEIILMEITGTGYAIHVLRIIRSSKSVKLVD